MQVGYARASSIGQSLDVQLDLLSEAGCGKVFSEKRSGRTTGGREALADALDFAREGDTFVVTRLDRLAQRVRPICNYGEAGGEEGPVPVHPAVGRGHGQLDRTADAGDLGSGCRL